MPYLEIRMSVDFVFLDSGTGGIPYLLHLISKAPTVSCIYVGDTANFPYGEKSHEEIVCAVVNVVKKIILSFDPKIIVVACNTMSVNALDVLREVFPEVKFVGTVPAVKLAASLSKKRIIGLLATNSTVNHPYNLDLKNQFASDCKLILRGDSELISFIEHKSFTANQEEILEAIKPAVDFFRSNDCDTIILGCTHFLNLANEFKKICEPDIMVVDSRDGVTKRALSLLNQKLQRGQTPMETFSNLTKKSKKNQKPTLYVTSFSDKKDKKEYDVICNRYNLNYGGILV